MEGVPLTLLYALGLSETTGPLAELIADGFLGLQDGRVAATARGRPLLDAVLKALLT
ncbi:hypothetical protein D1872_332040 [compost metagenome]